MSINAFLANFQGGARASLYRVTQIFPAAASSGGADQKMTYLCKGAQLPSSNVNPIEVFYMGRAVKVPGDRTEEDITLTIINDVDFGLRNAFERWNNSLIGHESNLQSDPFQSLLADLKIEQLDRNGAVIKTYDIIGCFPNNVSSIDVGFDQADTVEEFTVTLSFQYWVDDQNSIG